METVQAGLALCDIYYWFASGFGDLANLAKSHFSVWDGPILGSLTCTIVQYFFAYRIWVLSGQKSWKLSLMICFVNLMCFNLASMLFLKGFTIDSSPPSLECQSFLGVST